MIKKAVPCILAALVLCGCSGRTGKQTGADRTELTVLAAASLTDACGDIEKLYEEKNSDIDLIFSFGGSGALQTQIEEGAQADVFISAAEKQMNALREKGLMEDDTITELLENKIVLIVPKGNPSGIKCFEDVISDNVSVIALGEPSGVPVGQYSEEIFGNLGILESVRKKASYGSDVRQVLSWVETGNAECGVVYSTDAMIGKGIEVICEAPENSHSRVIYPAGEVRSSKHKEKAKELTAFLASEECRAVFEKYGFTFFKR